MKISKVVEWKPIYIDFELMDSLLQPFVTLNLFTAAKMKSMNKNPSFAYTSMLIDDQNCLQELERLNEKFVEKLCRDMSKCDRFYNLHLAQIEIKQRKLIYNIFIYMELQQNEQIKHQRYILKQYCEMLYLECQLLDQFSVYNQLIVKKLLKKYRKQVWFSETNDSLLKMTEQSQVQHEDLSKIQIRLKLLYTRYLTHKTHGNMKYLKYHNIYKGFSSKEQLLIGVYLGLSFCFLLYIISRRYQLNRNFYNNEFYYDLYFPMFRGIGLMILYYWSLIFCVYCWLKGHVGYRQILNFKYHCSSVNQLVKRAAGLTLIYLIVLIISLQKELYLEEEKSEYLIDYVTKKLPYDPAIGPFILWVFMLIYMCIPTKKYMNAKGRRYFWKIVFTSLLSGFYQCPFVNGWATDQLLSLAVMLKDFAYTACFYYEYFKDFDNTEKQAECGDPKNLEIGLIVCLVPIFLRFVQIGRCIHDTKKATFDDICVIIIYIEVLAVNVFSYLTQFGSIYLYFWIASFCALACNAYFWDLKKDWGLLQNGGYLRGLLAFSPIYYYIAILGEFFLRFAWVLSISPNMAASIHLWSPLFTLLMAILELCRRTLWNIFRIENVHIQNMGDFKAVQPIKLPFENLIDQEVYNNLKELKKNQVEPINISLLSGGSNSVAGQYYRTSLKSLSAQDQESLNELLKQEQDLFSENIFEDRQRESILINRYSQFKLENHDENLSKQQLIKDLSQINDLIKKMK